MNSTVYNAMLQRPSVPKVKNPSVKQSSSDKADDFRQLMGTKSEPRVDERPEQPKKDLTGNGQEENALLDENADVIPEVLLNGVLQIPAELLGITDFQVEDEGNSLAASQEPLTLGVFAVKKNAADSVEELTGQVTENAALTEADEGAQDGGFLTAVQQNADKAKQESAGQTKTNGVLPQENAERAGQAKASESSEKAEPVKQENHSGADKTSAAGQNGMDRSGLTSEKAGRSRSDERQNADSGNAELLAGKKEAPVYAAAESTESSGEVHTAQTSQSAGSTQESSLMRQVSDYLNQNALKSAKELELQLNPKELGKLSIRIASEDGKTQVTIMCSNSKTLKALSESAGEIGRIMENNLGTPTNIVTEYKEEAGRGYSEQNQNDNSGQNWNGESEENSGSNRHSEEKKQDRASFVQQLRLGLV